MISRHVTTQDAHIIRGTQLPNDLPQSFANLAP